MGRASCSHNRLYHEAARPYTSQLLGKEIFLTGLTGLFGRPVLELLCHEKKRCQDDAPVNILTRSTECLYQSFPCLREYSFIRPQEGDIRDYESPKGISPELLIHAASVGNREKFLGVDEQERFDVVDIGTRNILQQSEKWKLNKVLMISSGSVYGDNGQNRVDESCRIGPDTVNNPEACYAEGKRAAEVRAIMHGRKYSVNVTIARCFAFCGPGLPLDINFSIGNFIRDALEGRDITVLGDGTPVRSFMYTYDLAIWLFCLAVQGGDKEAYNIGSSRDISIGELALLVRGILSPSSEVRIEDGDKQCSQGRRSGANRWYVPDTRKIQREFNLRELTSLEETIYQTAMHHKACIDSERRVII